MKRNLMLSLYAAVCSIFLAGCTATTTLYPPCAQRDVQQFPKELYGKWTLKMSPDDEAWDIRISAHPQEKKQAGIEMQSETPQKTIPFIAGAFKIGNVRYLQISPDVEKILEKGGFGTDTAALIKPVHFICELRGTREKPEWHVITFLKQVKNPKKPAVKLAPIDASVIYGKDDHVVFNPSGDLMKLLREKKYEIAQKVLLVPKK